MMQNFLNAVRKLAIAFSILGIALVFSCGQPEKTKTASGLFPISQNGKYGYINKKGKIAIKPQFDFTWGFSEGLACVNIGDKDGFIDKTGKIVINPQFDNAGGFSEGQRKKGTVLFFC